MKFIHLGDLHIGKSLGEFDLLPDQRYILDQILDVALQQKVDAFLIAGDIYDKSIPSEGAVRLFDYFLRRLSEKKIPAFLITGNHDSDERLNFGSSLFETSGIYISAKYTGKLYKQTLADEYGPVNLYLMPFIKASQIRHFFPEETIADYDDAVRVVLQHAGIDPAERNILLSHQFVVGSNHTKENNEETSSDAGKLSDAELPSLAGSESVGTHNVGLVEQIRSSLFDAFDYVALGHIHSAQKISREEIRYSGSPLKYSLSEAMHEKSVPVITISEKGRTNIELIPLHPMRDLRHIKGTMKQLLAAENITDPLDFIYATLTDEEIIHDAMSIFQQYYPNTVRIEYQNSHTRDLQKEDFTQFTETRTFSEMFSEFYQMVYGCEITEEELSFMKEIAREAGVADETD